MASRSKRKLKSWLSAIEKTTDISVEISAAIETSAVKKQDIAKALKLKYVTFWRKVKLNKLSLAEMQKIVQILISSEETRH